MECSTRRNVTGKQIVNGMMNRNERDKTLGKIRGLTRGCGGDLRIPCSVRGDEERTKVPLALKRWLCVCLPVRRDTNSPRKESACPEPEKPCTLNTCVLSRHLAPRAEETERQGIVWSFCNGGVRYPRQSPGSSKQASMQRGGCVCVRNGDINAEPARRREKRKNDRKYF
jgi:hypothetical protein